MLKRKLWQWLVRIHPARVKVVAGGRCIGKTMVALECLRRNGGGVLVVPRYMGEFYKRHPLPKGVKAITDRGLGTRDGWEWAKKWMQRFIVLDEAAYVDGYAHMLAWYVVKLGGKALLISTIRYREQRFRQAYFNAKPWWYFSRESARFRVSSWWGMSRKELWSLYEHLDEPLVKQEYGTEWDAKSNTANP